MGSGKWDVTPTDQQSRKQTSTTQAYAELVGDKPAGQEKQQPEYYPDEDFQTNFPQWKAYIDAGKTTAEKVISIASKKAELTDAQKQQIRDLEKPAQPAESEAFDWDSQADDEAPF